jgi:hypothetical protein
MISMTSDKLKRSSTGIPALATKLLESLGLFNKGSAALTTGELTDEDAAGKTPVTPPSLNVTRVGGLAAVIAGAGTAALALFNIDKDADADAIVATAYASTGFVVAAALITAAVIIAADIRARTAATLTPVSASKVRAPSEATTPAADLRSAWLNALERLQNVKDELTTAQNRNDYSRLWLQAEASKGLINSVVAESSLADEHELLSRGQAEVCRILSELRTSTTNVADDVSELRTIVETMQSVVNNISIQE